MFVIGIDLRDIPRVERFCAFFLARFSRLDILINNACQTVRRPTSYYAALARNEAKAASLIGARSADFGALEMGGGGCIASPAGGGGAENAVGVGAEVGVLTAAMQSQIALTDDDLSFNVEATAQGWGCLF